MMNQSPFPTMYNRLINAAVEVLLSRKHLTAEEALNAAVKKLPPVYGVYLASFKPGERAEMERLVKARRNAAKEKWQAEA